MTSSILADEGLSGLIVNELRSSGYSIDWILETNPGISDKEVINIAKKHCQILITEDKDFGEWVFAHSIKCITVVFLRYDKVNLTLIVNFLKNLIDEKTNQPSTDYFEFITINKNKVRRRRIQ